MNVAERLEQRQEELLGRVGAAVGERTGALLGRARGDEVQHGGPAAERQARGLAEDGNAVDPRPVERLEQGEPHSLPAVGGRLRRMPEAIRPAPRRLARRARLDAEPRAVGNPNPRAFQRPRGRRAKDGDERPPAIHDLHEAQ